jgi:hypothetical protein
VNKILLDGRVNQSHDKINGFLAREALFGLGYAQARLARVTVATWDNGCVLLALIAQQTNAQSGRGVIDELGCSHVKNISE